mmetsp:Transcript_10506/g.33970  ORF Transcript_10506/g.33970 Transcript_10506/m.33970 type:complete len:275 (-) Transcript_10506:92-916(-)
MSCLEMVVLTNTSCTSLPLRASSLYPSSISSAASSSWNSGAMAVPITLRPASTLAMPSSASKRSHTTATSGIEVAPPERSPPEPAGASTMATSESRVWRRGSGVSCLMDRAMRRLSRSSIVTLALTMSPTDSTSEMRAGRSHATSLACTSAGTPITFTNAPKSVMLVTSPSTTCPMCNASMTSLFLCAGVSPCPARSDMITFCSSTSTKITTASISSPTRVSSAATLRARSSNSGSSPASAALTAWKRALLSCLSGMKPPEMSERTTTPPCRED